MRHKKIFNCIIRKFWTPNEETDDVCRRPREANIAATIGPGTPWTDGPERRSPRRFGPQTPQRKVSLHRTVRISTSTIRRWTICPKTEFFPLPPKVFPKSTPKRKYCNKTHRETEPTTLTRTCQCNIPKRNMVDREYHESISKRRASRTELTSTLAKVSTQQHIRMTATGDRSGNNNGYPANSSRSVPGTSGMTFSCSTIYR